MRFALHLLARLALAVFVLLTWAYGVASYSPFAFDMFIRPRLLPALTEFVAWHHLWYWGPYLLLAASLVVEMAAPDPRSGGSRAERWLAAAFLAVFGVIGVRLATTPYLPSLSNDAGSLVAALGSLVPIAWIALIDHVAGWRALKGVTDGDARTTGQRQLLAACVAAAVYLWLTHNVISTGGAGGADGVDALEWFVSRAWGLTVWLTTFMAVYLTLGLAMAIAAQTRATRLSEHALIVVIIAAGIGEVLRRVVLPAVSFDERVAVPVSVITGAALALLWSGLALRRPGAEGDTSLERLVSPARRQRAAAALVLVLLPVVMGVALGQIATLDWNGVIQKVMTVAEWTVVFALFLRVCANMGGRPWSARLLAAPSLAALAAMYGIPHAASHLSAFAGEAVHIDAVLDRFAATDVGVRLQAAAYIEQRGLDRDYYRYLQQTAASSLNGGTSLPAVEFATTPRPPAARAPHIFFFVIDSLRPDYLSPYNPAVDFTPAIDRFAHDSFVFRRAFTRYGGTWLSLPSIWVGGSAYRGWGGTAFHQINAVEKLIARDGYRVVINDGSLAPYLSKSIPTTVVDAELLSGETDLCRHLTSLDANLEANAADPRPVLAYFRPQNVHLLNTRSGKTLAPGEQYPGFYGALASRVKRLDACFGSFVSSLEQRGLYEDSIIIVTSDHGDSVGERGNWGHQFWLFPEDIQVPLIIHIPASLRPDLTTDLSQVAFVTDIAPTLYGLLGHGVRDLGPLFGSPLFVPSDRDLPSRRRESFLVASSYGPTHALLRRNGRSLYISDVAAGREFAFELGREPLGSAVQVSDDLRRINQRLIRERAAAVSTLYGITVP